MTDLEKSKSELNKELKKLRQENEDLKALRKKDFPHLLQETEDATQVLKMFQNIQKLAKIGIWEWNVLSDRVKWSEELFRINPSVEKLMEVDLETLTVHRLGLRKELGKSFSTTNLIENFYFQLEKRLINRCIGNCNNECSIKDCLIYHSHFFFN